MIVAIHHDIKARRKFGEVVTKIGTMIEGNPLPEGIKPLTFLPSTDGSKALCVWEVDSVETLKTFLEPQTGQFARNEHFEVDAEKAQGLPQGATAEATTAQATA